MKPLAVSAGSIVEVDDALVLAYGISGVLVVGVGAAPWYPTRNISVVGVIPAVGVAPTGSAIIFDLNMDGTTMFSTQANRPTIAISALVGSLAVPDITDVDFGSFLTTDVDQIGSTVAGSHATVQVLYRWRI